MSDSRGRDPDTASIAAAANSWLAEDRPPFGVAATLGAPLMIRAPSGAPDGWFVPLLAGERLLGYLRFTADGSRRGLSSFQRRPGDIASCPLAADWLDPGRITDRAREHAAPGANAAAPVLSLDGSPERLAWRVDFSDPNGRRFAVCVAGTVAWRCDAAG